MRDRERVTEGAGQREKGREGERERQRLELRTLKNDFVTLCCHFLSFVF